MKDQLARDIRGWDAIEDHRTGTEGDGQTTAWLADCIAAAGAEPYVDTFAFVRPVLHECAVSVDGRRADGVPLFDGGTTDADGIMAPLAPLAAAETGIGFASSGPWAAAGDRSGPRSRNLGRPGANLIKRPHCPRACIGQRRPLWPLVRPAGAAGRERARRLVASSRGSPRKRTSGGAHELTRTPPRATCRRASPVRAPALRRWSS